jgi:hypothetical protein
VLPNSGAVLPLLGGNLSGEGAALTRRSVAFARTVAAHASALLLQPIARRCDGTARRWCTVTVIRRAASETGGLTVVSAYLPRVSRAGHTF